MIPSLLYGTRHAILIRENDASIGFEMFSFSIMKM